MSNEGFSAGPAPINPEIPKFEWQEQWIQEVLRNEYEESEVKDMILDLDDTVARGLFFATFYRPPTDERQDAELTSEMDVVGTMNYLEKVQNSPVVETIRTGVLLRRDMQAIEMMKHAAAYYPESLEWFRAAGYMTSRRTRRMNTKILIDLCAFTGKNSLEFLASLIGYAIKDVSTNQEREDIWVCVFLLGASEVLDGSDAFNQSKEGAVRQILTQGPPAAVREMVRAKFPAVDDPIQKWDHDQVLFFVSQANGLVKSRMMAPDVRRVVAAVVRDVHIHAILIKDEDVVAHTSNWISSTDSTVNLIRRVVDGTDRAKSAAPIDSDEKRLTREILDEALRFGILMRTAGARPSVQRAFEEAGLTRDVVQTVGYEDERIREMVGVSFNKLKDADGLHIRALKFAISFVSDYFKYLQTKKDSTNASEIDPATGLSFSEIPKWTLAKFRSLYFKKSVSEIVPELDQTPIEHFTAVALSGDNSTTGGSQLFAILAKYFGINLLRKEWLAMPSLETAEALVYACDASVRSSNTPGGVIVDLLLTKLKAVYPTIPSSRKVGTSTHFLIDPVRMAAADYLLKWKENEDGWYASEVIEMINDLNENGRAAVEGFKFANDANGQSFSMEDRDPWTQTIRKLQAKKATIQEALKRM